ncbi:hypothetical protein Pelo_6731 [Pelomyxa schiedti]|nr:hypothetical protein Pelo_6731 [Pelomyxa schiedti]
MSLQFKVGQVFCQLPVQSLWVNQNSAELKKSVQDECVNIGVMVDLCSNWYVGMLVCKLIELQSVLEMKNALLSCRADMQHWKSVLKLQQSLLCFRFAFQSSCAIPGASKWCENAFENSADSSSVRNSPKRECLSAEMIGCLPMQIAMVARIEMLGDHSYQIDCLEAAA